MIGFFDLKRINLVIVFNKGGRFAIERFTLTIMCKSPVMKTQITRAGM